MNRDLENWEEIISSKFDGQQFPFNEGDWDRAEEMIEKAELKTKRKRWFTIYFLGIISGALVMLIAAKFIFTNSSKTNQTIVAAQKENSSSPLTQNKETHDQVTKENVIATENISVKPVAKENQSDNQKEVLAEKINQLTAENNKLRTELANQNLSNPVSAQKQNNTTTDNHSVNPATISSSDNQQQNLNNPVIVQQLNLGISDNSVVKSDNQSATKENDAKLPLAVFVADSTPKSADTLPIVFGKMNPVLDPLLPPKDTSFHARNVFSVEAGITYNFGWNYNDTIDGRGINPVAGFAVSHLFNPKWSLTTGIRFASLGHLHYSQKQVTDSIPNFGLNNTSTLIIPQSLYYITIPLKFERTIKKKNFIGLGTSFSYLFNTTSRIETINERDGYQMLVGDPKTQYGYFGGLNRFDVAFNLSYRRQLFPKWGIMLEGTYGLMDIKNNSYFNNSQNQGEHNLGGRFVLTYNLF